MIAFLALASAFAAPAADDAVFMTVAYCPDLFSGMGAVVRVNHPTAPSQSGQVCVAVLVDWVPMNTR